MLIKTIMRFLTGEFFRLSMDSDSPAPAPTNTSQTTSNIPDWAIPYATKVLGNAQNLTDINQNPYQTYQGNRVADFNPLQNQAFSNVAGMTTNAGTGNAMNQTQDAYNRSANAGPYNAQNFGNQYGSGPQFQNMGLGYLAANAPQLNQYQMGRADQVSGNNVNNQNINSAQSNYRPDLDQYQMGPASQVRSQNFGQQSVQDYMSPYQQNVTDIQKQEAIKDYGRQLPGQNAQASSAGAFGGTRQALVAAEGQRNLQTQLGGIQAAGSQNAYQNAQQQFNADQARRQQAQMSNQQAGLTVGQQNLASQLQTQGLRAGQSLQVAMSNLSNRQQTNVQNAANNLQAQGMNAEQAMRAALANQQAGLTVGQQNLSSKLQTQALGAGQDLQVAMSNLSNRQQANVQNAANNLQAQGMNAEQAMRAALANQQAGLTVGQQNLQSQLQTQALGSGQSMQAQLANQGAYGQMQGLGMQQNLSANQQAMQNAAQQAQYGLAGQQAGEASRQFGANYGLQNRQQALAAAGQLGTLGQQQYTQQMGINAAQQQAGAQIQAQEQQGISNKYQDFLNTQNYPYKQLGFMSDIIRGTPTSGGAQSMYQAPPSGISQFAGLAGGLGSLYGGYNQAMKGAAGGEIKGYAEGGAVAFDNGGDVVPRPSAAEFMVANEVNKRPNKNDTSGLGALLKAAGMGADLQNLIVAQKQVKTKQQEDTIRDLQNRLAQATGMPEQQNTTVEEDVRKMLQQEVESRQGGIADLDTGNLGDNYAGGGIVAFTDNKDQPVQADMPTSPAGRWASSVLQSMRKEGAEAAEKQAAENKIRIQHGMAAGPLGVFMNQSDEQRAAAQAAIAGVNNPAAAPAPAAPVPADAPQTSGADSGAPTDRDPATGRRIINGRVEDAPAGAPAPSTSPLAPRPSGYAAPSGAPAVDSADSDHTKLMATLQGNIDEGRALLKKGIQPREVNKTAGEHAADLREQDNAYLKARGLPTAEESMKERLDNLATAGREARNNRDVDRWMAAAQGFFAMAGGKSQYAMQNMAEGLNIGVKELRAVEQDYRKIDQLQKDKAELLKEATRQEARGDFAKGDALRKEIDDRNAKIDATNLTVAERLLHYSGDAMGRAIAAKSANDARKAADAARAQAAEIAATGRQDLLNERKESRIERDTQNRSQLYLNAVRTHPLNLGNKALPTLEADLMRSDPKTAKEKEAHNKLEAQVKTMRKTVHEDAQRISRNADPTKWSVVGN